MIARANPSEAGPASAKADSPHVVKIDRDGRLLHADARVAELHKALGGAEGEVLAIPALLDLARHAMRLGMRLSRPLTIIGPKESVDLWCDCEPGTQGIDLRISQWRERPLPEAGPAAPLPIFVPSSETSVDIRVDPLGRILHVQDMVTLPAHWDAERVTLKPVGALIATEDGAPLVLADCHNGVRVRLIGDPRCWTLYRSRSDAGAGWNLQLTEAPAAPEPQAAPSPPPLFDGERLAHMFGSQIGPALRQPIGRIIANAETIGGRLEGPLRSDYAGYAGDIASAGRHLLALIDDLADLEAIEASGFSAASEPVDLADLARRAAGLLALKAADRSIRIDKPAEDESLAATGEFRRVLQVLLNLLGNAINYAPDGSMIWLRLDEGPDWASVTVADQGPGLSEEDQQRLFNKWERLGRSGDGGSGLGLYISRRLALAMQGDLTVESAPGQGARFTLVLPKI
ncbi:MULTISPECIES: HAMP domain-containing sensor histidine kinase [Pseudomonadota]|uniref:sensor histidine kinase n=3 Tax=Pseudomonadota TaxID=1224 RepID=UPI000AD34558|nr:MULTISPECIES: HAMP domain-containing sensor histidine kinase [Pseudomonadota]